MGRFALMGCVANRVCIVYSIYMAKLFLSLMVAAMPLVGAANVAGAVPMQVSETQLLAELQILINQIRLVVADLDRQVQKVVQAHRYAGFISPVGEASTVVTGSRTASLARLVLNAADKDLKLVHVTLVLEAPEDNSQKGLSNCQLWDGAKSLTTGVDPIPSKRDTGDVSFVFLNEFTLAKGTFKTLILACDVTKDPQGPAVYTWRLGTSSGKKITLIQSGSFVLELASSTPAARGVRGGAQGEVATVFDFYAAGEALELNTLALQIDGNPKAVAAYELWDESRKIGEGALSGDTMFKAAFSAPFVIPNGAHRSLTVKVNLKPLGAGGLVHAGDTVAINFNGNQGNFNLTYGIGTSSGRGIVPSVFTDTDAPAMTLQ